MDSNHKSPKDTTSTLNRQPTFLVIVTLLAGGILYGLHELVALAIAQWQTPSLHGDSFTFIIRGHDKSLTEWIVSQHNEHRIIPAKIISVIESELLKIPPGQSGIFQNLALILACIGQWFWLCRRLLKRADLRIITGLAGSLILVNPWQYENLSWEFQTPWFLINALVLSCSLILSAAKIGAPTTNPASFLALVLPWIALSSTGQGLALVMAFMVCAWLTSRKLGGVVSASSGLAALTFYVLLPYAKPANHPELTFKLGYFLRAWLGGAWEGLALFFIIIVGVLLSQRKAIPRGYWPVILMPGLFSVAFAGMVTLSRSGFGLEQANESRYVTHSLMLGLSALAAMALSDDQNRGRQTPLLGGFLVIITTLGALPQSLSPSGMTYLKAWEKAAKTPEKKRAGLACHAQQAVMAEQNINMLKPCKGIFPQEDIVDRYFLGGWPVKPMGWHKQLLQENSSLQPGTIRYQLENQVLARTSLKLQGWGFIKEYPDQQLFLFADYGTAGQLAIRVDQPRRDIKQSLKISNKAVGFNTTIPRSHTGKPLLTVSIGMLNNRVQIWQDPSDD